MSGKRTKSFLLAVSFGLASSLLFADAPAVINYQGKLADANGNPQNGNVPMVFSVYNTATGGSALFSDDRTSAGQQVPVTNGIFNVLIGTGTSLGGSAGGLRQAIQSGTSLYLQVTVNSTPLLPRQRLVASPYALAVAPGAISDSEVSSSAGISVTKLSAGVFPAGNYSFTGSTVSISALTVSGGLNMNGRAVSNLPTTPAAANDAASKSYVDAQISGAGAWLMGGSNNTYLANSGDSVGIGVSNPATKLHVAGSGLFTGPLTVQGSSVTISTLGTGGSPQMVVANGAGVLSVQAIPGGGSAVAGSGSANNISFWTGGNTLSYDAITPLFWDSANHRLGIGTTTPAQRLDVTGNVNVSGNMTLTGTLQSGTVPDARIAGSGTLVSNLNADLLDGLSSSAFAAANHNHDSTYLKLTGGTLSGPLTLSGSSLNFSGVTSDITSDSGEHIALMPGGAGHVGIGTTQPGQMLTVAGMIESTSGGFKFPDGTTMTSAGSGSASSLSNSVDAIVTGDADANGNGKVILQTGANDRLTVLNNGNVGVGTTTPGTKLDVNGTLNATTIQQNGSALGTAAFSAASSFLNKGGDTMTGLLTLSGSGLKFSDGTTMTTAASGGLSASTNFGGDVSGTYNAIVVANDSHNHTGATISGLSASNFTSPNISQWTNNSGYVTSAGTVANATNAGTATNTNGSGNIIYGAPDGAGRTAMYYQGAFNTRASYADSAGSASGVPWSGISGLPAFAANQNAGRVRMYEVGCAGAWGSSCDGNANGYVDYADAAGGISAGSLTVTQPGGRAVINSSGAGDAGGAYAELRLSNTVNNKFWYFEYKTDDKVYLTHFDGTNYNQIASWSPSGGKTFIIQHPTDQSKYLVHATLEGPENGVYYRGEGQLKDGLAEIKLPDYFEALTHEEGRTVLLTPTTDNFDELVSPLVASSVRAGKFKVKGIDNKNRSQKFYWEVKAIRKDVAPLFVEPNKDQVQVHGDGPYKYYYMKK